MNYNSGYGSFKCDFCPKEGKYPHSGDMLLCDDCHDDLMTGLHDNYEDCSQSRTGSIQMPEMPDPF